MSAHPLRILLIEDHLFFRESLLLLLHESPEVAVVGEASSGAEALAVLPACTPDIVILDLNLPDISGVELVEHMRKISGSQLPILVLTGAGDSGSLYMALKGGAMGYLRKDHITLERLIFAIMSMRKGLVILDRETLPLLLEAF